MPESGEKSDGISGARSMSDMVERVATAICESNHIGPRGECRLTTPQGTLGGCLCDTSMRNRLRESARAAIKAVRDLLKEEAETIPLGDTDKHVGDSAYNHAMFAVWRIDTALEADK